MVMKLPCYAVVSFCTPCLLWFTQFGVASLDLYLFFSVAIGVGHSKSYLENLKIEKKRSYRLGIINWLLRQYH